MDTKNRVTVARQAAGETLDERGERIKKYKLVVTNSHESVKCSTGNTANNILITTYGGWWVVDILGDHFLKYKIV